ncbi:MAG: Tnp 1 protein, partial [Bacteroidetes bacterium]|nr:Tnp 1 protein [Bacteroidota bacterium]
EKGFCRRGKGLAHPIHKNTLADALERLTDSESQGIFAGSVTDLVKAKLVDDTVFSLDGTELPATEHYPQAGRVTSAREVKDKWGGVKTITSTRYGYLLLSLRGITSNTVAAARVDKIGKPEHPWVLPLVQAAKSAGARVKVLLIDGAYCVGNVLWQLKHEEKVDFVVPADSSMCITEDARGLVRFAVPASMFRCRRNTVHDPLYSPGKIVISLQVLMGLDV